VTTAEAEEKVGNGQFETNIRSPLFLLLVRV